MDASFFANERVVVKEPQFQQPQRLTEVRSVNRYLLLYKELGSRFVGQ